LEETGYSVVPRRFVALFEEINDSLEFRDEYPQYAHKMLHIFVCSLASDDKVEPSETDDLQVASEWVEISDVTNRNLLPKIVKERFRELLNAEKAVFLGSDHLPFNHG
jgi:ADP-ribose pyrophosphatase YjhB (NUDIX family)